MKNKGFCIIRTKKDNVLNVFSIATFDFIKKKKKRFDYNKSFLCDSFEVVENVGGEVIIEMCTNMKHSKVDKQTTLTFEKDIIEFISIEDFIC